MFSLFPAILPAVALKQKFYNLSELTTKVHADFLAISAQPSPVPAHALGQFSAPVF